jgi:hypothetical protein
VYACSQGDGGSACFNTNAITSQVTIQPASTLVPEELKSSLLNDPFQGEAARRICLQTYISPFFTLFHHTQYQYGYTIRSSFLTTCFGLLSHHQVSDFYIHMYSSASIPYIGQCLYTGILVFLEVCNGIIYKKRCVHL